MKNEQKLHLQEMRRERLIILIDNLGVGGQKRLAEALGIAADYVSRLLYPSGKKGKKGISGDMARRIEQYFAVQIGWLDGLEQTGLRPARKKAAQAPGKTLPLLAWTLPLSHEQLNKGTAVHYPAMVQCSVQAYWLPVRDDTMSGSNGANYPKGALILVEPTAAGITELVSGDKVIAKRCDNAELTFRKYVEEAGHRWLKGSMPDCPALNADEYAIIGVVLGAWLP
ncbi:MULTISPECIES: LexA family protein [Serratia]|uniref:LexA family protein n=1 Tax=Serratia TaxID=613 RepID=UPI0011F2B972|nr:MULTISPECIES: S24 family peptidase [Serratia]NRN16444.1 S26 family signal peptidase [Serratia marcescens]NRN39363.1 S26 family signal peptidase [Serratia marcescens]